MVLRAFVQCIQPGNRYLIVTNGIATNLKLTANHNSSCEWHRFQECSVWHPSETMAIYQHKLLLSWLTGPTSSGRGFRLGTRSIQPGSLSRLFEVGLCSKVPTARATSTLRDLQVQLQLLGP